MHYCTLVADVASSSSSVVILQYRAELCWLFDESSLRLYDNTLMGFVEMLLRQEFD